MLTSVVIEPHGLTRALGLIDQADSLKLIETPDHLALQVWDDGEQQQVLTISLDQGHVTALFLELRNWLRLQGVLTKGDDS
jgi:hypothetical protein